MAGQKLYDCHKYFSAETVPRATGLFLDRSPAIVLEAIKPELAARRVLAAEVMASAAGRTDRPLP